MSWCKGFSISGVIGEDVAQLLKEACKRKVMVAVNEKQTKTLLKTKQNKTFLVPKY